MACSCFCMICSVCSICATPIVLNIACNNNFSISYLIFCNATLLCICFACRALFFRPVLPTVHAFTWATPSHGRRLYLGDAFFLGDASHYFKRRKIKTENQDTSFSQLVLPFIRVTSLKNPRKGKRASPSTTLLHTAYISQLK